jgi:molybdopterin-containing oxidoreductase family membrane subunit
MYAPTWVDWAIFIGSIGLFLTLLFVFIRVLPMISIFEMRTVLPSPKSRPAPVPSAAPAGD